MIAYTEAAREDRHPRNVPSHARGRLPDERSRPPGTAASTTSRPPRVMRTCWSSASSTRPRFARDRVRHQRALDLDARRWSGPLSHRPAHRAQSGLTNGAGVNAPPIAEFVVLCVLSAAKSFPFFAVASERHEWPAQRPPAEELDGARALVLGYGEIGRGVGERLRAFGVRVTGVRRTPSEEPDIIGPDDWRARLDEFDYILVTAALHAETHHMLGAAEFARMRPTAWVVNVLARRLGRSRRAGGGAGVRSAARRVSGCDRAGAAARRASPVADAKRYDQRAFGWTQPALAAALCSHVSGESAAISVRRTALEPGRLLGRLLRGELLAMNVRFARQRPAVDAVVARR